MLPESRNDGTGSGSGMIQSLPDIIRPESFQLGAIVRRKWHLVRLGYERSYSEQCRAHTAGLMARRVRSRRRFNGPGGGMPATGP